MKSKTTLVIAVFALLTLFGACWQAWEAARLDSRLRAIDEQSQIERLTELSTERICAAASELLAAERAKLGEAPDLTRLDYPMPAGDKADYVKGYFLLTPDSLRVPQGETAFEKALTENATLIDTIRRKAFNPAAPVLNPNEADKVNTATQDGVFAVFEANDTDPAAPLAAKGEPSTFFAWNYLDDVVYMRRIPTTHGTAAEGVVLDAAKLAARLLPLAEPGLREAEISHPNRYESANLAPLPLVLRPGKAVDIPNTAARHDAVQRTVRAAWFTTLLTIGILFAILAVYARLERRRSDFVSAVTHELRTPLTSFQMMTEMLANDLVPADKVDEYHDNLHRESKRLAHLVENVLAFARLTRGKVRGRQDAAPCRQLLSGVFEKTAERLLPLAEPGLKEAEIAYPNRYESANLTPLPLVLRPGKAVDIPDTEARHDAVQRTVRAAWFTTLLTIGILFAILAFYARMERRRSDFVSAVTHELRTPLTSFQLMTEMLANGLVPAEKVGDYHNNLHRESKRLAHLVENVLSFSRLTRGKIRGRQDAGPCRQLLGGVLEKTAERLRAAGFKVSVTQDSRTELLSLRTDILSLEQILTNLTDNAIKYAGGVNAPAVSISTMRSHRSLQVRFADNGPSMQDDVRRHLFQPFSHTAQPNKPGIGLGLALSRDIARSIGGELSLEKSTSQGTSFILTLPLGE